MCHNYMQRDRDRQTDRQSERDRDRDTERDRERDRKILRGTKRRPIYDIFSQRNMTMLYPINK